MSDPRKNKKFLIKALGGDVNIYNDFLILYDEAVAEGSIIPEEIAWIRFREIYQEADDGWFRI